MKIKRITALSLIAVLSASMLCACSSADTSSSSNTSGSVTSSAYEEIATEETTEEETTEEATEEETVFENIITTNPVDESCKLYDFTVKIDGNEYSVPCDFSDVEKYGFSLGDSDNQIEAGCYTLGSVGIKNDSGTKISLTFWNASDSTKKYSECKVGCISAFLDEVSEIILPGDFKFTASTTVDEVTAQYGQPTELREDYNSYLMKYSLEAYRHVYIEIYKDKDDGTKNNVTVENMVEN